MRTMKLLAFLLAATLCASAAVVSAFTFNKPKRPALTHFAFDLEEAPPTTARTVTDNDGEKVDISSLPLPPTQGRNLFRNIRDSISYINGEIQPLL